MAIKLSGRELQGQFLSLLAKNSYDIWDKEDTLKNIGKLSLDEEKLEKMEKGLKSFASHRSETEKTFFFKIDKMTFFFSPYCSVQAQGAVMVSELIEITL